MEWMIVVSTNMSINYYSLRWFKAQQKIPIIRKGLISIMPFRQNGCEHLSLIKAAWSALLPFLLVVIVQQWLHMMEFMLCTLSKALAEFWRLPHIIAEPAGSSAYLPMFWDG